MGMDIKPNAHITKSQKKMKTIMTRRISIGAGAIQQLHTVIVKMPMESVNVKNVKHSKGDLQWIISLKRLRFCKN